MVKPMPKYKFKWGDKVEIQRKHGNVWLWERALFLHSDIDGNMTVIDEQDFIDTVPNNAFAIRPLAQIS